MIAALDEFKPFPTGNSPLLPGSARGLVTMRYMLDTNICIYAIKNRPASVIAALRAHESAGIGISAVSVGELYFGVKKAAPRNLLALQHFLQPLEIADFDPAAAETYKIRQQLEAAGTPVGPWIPRLPPMPCPWASPWSKQQCAGVPTGGGVAAGELGLNGFRSPAPATAHSMDIGEANTYAIGVRNTISKFCFSRKGAAL